MLLMIVCGLLVLAGLAAVVRWGAEEVRPAPAGESSDQPPASLVARRYARCVTLAVVAGFGSGVLIAGAGGRLAMRLLAVTAGEGAQGRVTEAEEIVGQITTDGTIGFVLGEALFLGPISGVIYLLIRRWLPGGRLGGLAFGLLLLVIAGTSVDPLRAGNPDFDIVGPGWVAVAAFGAVVVVHGMLVAALAGRYSRVLGLPSRNSRTLAPYAAPLIVLAVVGPVMILPIAAVGAVTVGISRMTRLVVVLRSRGTVVAGRVAVVAAGLVALPGFVSALVDIASRRP